MDDIKYSLYEFPLSEAGLKVAEKEKYSRIAHDRVLVYKQGRKPSGARRVSEEEAAGFSQGDAEWLLTCNTEIIFNLAKSAKEFTQKVKDLIDRFEVELQRSEEESADV